MESTPSPQPPQAAPQPLPPLTQSEERTWAMFAHLSILVNLVSGPPVLLRRSGPEPTLAALQVALLQEARQVLEAAGWRAEPACGCGQSVDELIAHFRAGGSAPDTSGGIFNSTWQNLHHQRPRVENAFYHGEIIRLGARVGVATPVNERALRVLEEACASRLGPEPFDLLAFRARFADLLDEAALLDPAARRPLPGRLVI